MTALTAAVRGVRAVRRRPLAPADWRATARWPRPARCVAAGSLGEVRTAVAARLGVGLRCRRGVDRPDRGRHDRSSAAHRSGSSRQDGLTLIVEPDRSCGREHRPRTEIIDAELPLLRLGHRSSVVLLAARPVALDPGREPSTTSCVVYRLGQHRRVAWSRARASCSSSRSSTGPRRSTCASSSSRSPARPRSPRTTSPITIDFLIYWRIVDPLKSVVNVAGLRGRAGQGIATTTPARRHRRHPARRRALQARPDQRGPAHQARRDHRDAGAARSPPSRSARSPRRATSWTR